MEIRLHFLLCYQGKYQLRHIAHIVITLPTYIALCFLEAFIAFRSLEGRLGLGRPSMAEVVLTRFAVVARARIAQC